MGRNNQKIYTKAADGVIALQDKVGRYQTEDVAFYREKWDEIKSILSEAPTNEKMLTYVSAIGLDYSQYEERYDVKSSKTRYGLPRT